MATLISRLDRASDRNLELVARVVPLAAIVPAFVLFRRFKRHGIAFPHSFRLIVLLAFGLALVNALSPWTRWTSMCDLRM